MVVVTNWAWGTGLGWTPVATSPAMCAMSIMNRHPADWAMAASRTKSMMRG